jgi:transposase
MPEYEEIHAAFEKGEAAVVELFNEVGKQIEELAAQLEKQGEALKELQARLNKNSHNSSKPPSSDGYGKANRTESLRKSGEKPNGGQLGHEGHTLQASDKPDRTETYTPEQCEHCQASLKAVESTAYEERQVFDIPAIRIEVTAHRVEIKICPECGKETKGKFPEGVTQSTQYGNEVKTWATYFSNQHHIPLERTAQIFEDLIEHRVSEATVLKASEELSDSVERSAETVKEMLRESEVLKLDESGMRVKGKLHWLHVTSTDRLTHYEVHARRGKEAMDEVGILNDFRGTAMHDHWKPYFKYEDCSHALCNAHHLRELQYIEKQYNQSWAKEMSELLLGIKKAVDETRPHADRLPEKVLGEFELRYDDIVKAGEKVNPRSPPKEEGKAKKRGRTKQSAPFNLLIRLKDYKPQTLAFMYDFRVPFDNNEAERDVRMMKVKQKVSGCFRTVEGAKRFGRIRGYISTARKNAKNVFEAIRDAFKGDPFIPCIDET